MSCKIIEPQIKISPIFSSVKNDFFIFIIIQSTKHQIMDLVISVSAFASNNCIDVALNERRPTFYQQQYWRCISKAVRDWVVFIGHPTTSIILRSGLWTDAFSKRWIFLSIRNLFAACDMHHYAEILPRLHSKLIQFLIFMVPSTFDATTHNYIDAIRWTPLRGHHYVDTIR